MSDTTLLIEDQVHRYPKYYLASFSAWIGSFSLGTVLGYSAAAFSSFNQEGSHIHLDGLTHSLFASLTPLGAIIGSICAGFLSESYGRKGTLIFTTLPFVSGWLSIGYSGNMNSLVPLMIGRFLTGLCCGLISLTGPCYIAETADPERRGFFGSGFQLTVTFGIVTTYLLGKYYVWSTIALILAIFPFLMLITILCMPESPSWLLKVGRISEATEANMFLFGAVGSRRQAVDFSIPTLGQDPSEGVSANPTTLQQFRLFALPKYYKPLTISMALMFFQQFCGVNAIIFYMTSIFEDSDFDAISPTDSTIIVGAIQVLATLLACFLCDKFGRRCLLVISSLGAFTSLIPMIIFYYLNDKHFIFDFNIFYGWIPIVSLISFLIFFSLGLGPIPWLIMGEILPFNVRKISTIIVSSFNWLCAFIIVSFFNGLIASIGNSMTYSMFSVICLACAIFCMVYLPETKGKSFQEIAELFTQGSQSPQQET